MKHHSKFALYLVVLFTSCLAQAGSYEDFFKAVKLDNVRTVNALLERGFDPDSPDEHGNPALVLALSEDSEKVVDALLAQPRLHIDAANAKGETALMMAALHGRLGTARRLLDRGARLNRPGWTPLHYAASGPEPALVALLLDRGADIEAPSPNGTTPLMMAAQYGAIDSATLLLARGARADARNQLGLGAVDFARAAGRDKLAARIEEAVRGRP